MTCFEYVKELERHEFSKKARKLAFRFAALEFFFLFMAVFFIIGNLFVQFFFIKRLCFISAIFTGLIAYFIIEFVSYIYYYIATKVDNMEFDHKKTVLGFLFNLPMFISFLVFVALFIGLMLIFS